MAQTPSAVLSGPGKLHYAPLTAGVPEAAPAAAPATWDTAPGGGWIDAGFTDDGVSFEWDLTFESVLVAESAAALRTLWTEAEYRLVAVLAQFQFELLNLALNGAEANTITDVPGPPVERTFSPPDVGQDVAHSLLFQYQNENAAGGHIYVPLGKNTAAASIPFAKAPQKSTLGVEFVAQVPDTGSIFTIREYVSAS